MAIRHMYTILCDYVFQDAITQKMGFVGIFQNIDLLNIPGALAQFYVIVGAIGEEGEEFEILVANAERSWQMSLVKSTIGSSRDKDRVAVTAMMMYLPGLMFADPCAH